MSTRTSPPSRRARIMQLLARVFQTFSRSQETPPITPQHIRKILWIRLDHIGDVVMSLPSLQLLREQYPRAQIHVVVRPACKALFADLSIQDRVLVYDSPRFPSRNSQGRGRGAGLFRTVQFVRKLRRQNYDVAIEPRGDDIARFLCWASQSSIRLGPGHIFYESPDAPNFRFLMTHVETPSPALPLRKGKGEPNAANRTVQQVENFRVCLPSPYKGEGPGMGSHAVCVNCAILSPLFTYRVLDIPNFRFPFVDARRERVQKILQQQGVGETFVVLHPCSNDDKRNWNTSDWARVIDFVTEHPCDVVLSGIARDQKTHQEIIRLAKTPARVHDLAGAIPLPDLPAFFCLARLLVTVDTGPMHIAAFVNTPIVALFLPHLAPRHAPWGQEHNVVLPPLVNNEYSIKNIAVDDVLSAIARQLGNTIGE